MRETSLEELKELAKSAKGQIDRVYMHWTAGRYDTLFEDYHISITGGGEVFVSVEDLTERLSHTWKRNSNAIGVSMCCCYNAHANEGVDTDFGEYPPTPIQIETLAKVIATLSVALNLPMTVENFMTHCEIATIDEYGPHSNDPETRWDLWYLPDYDGTMKLGGEVIRGKANWYLSQEKEEEQC